MIHTGIRCHENPPHSLSLSFFFFCALRKNILTQYAKELEEACHFVCQQIRSSKLYKTKKKKVSAISFVYIFLYI